MASLGLDRSDISRVACEKSTRPAGNSSLLACLPLSLRFLGEIFRTMCCLRGKKMGSGDLIYGPAESETGRQAGSSESVDAVRRN